MSELKLLQLRPASSDLRTVAVTVIAVVRLGSLCAMVTLVTSVVPRVRLGAKAWWVLLDDIVV